MVFRNLISIFNYLGPVVGSWSGIIYLLDYYLEGLNSRQARYNVAPIIHNRECVVGPAIRKISLQSK